MRVFLTLSYIFLLSIILGDSDLFAIKHLYVHNRLFPNNHLFVNNRFPRTPTPNFWRGGAGENLVSNKVLPRNTFKILLIKSSLSARCVFCRGLR